MQAATFGVQDVSTVHMSDEKKVPLPTDGKGEQLAFAPILAAPAALQHKEKIGLMRVKVATAPSPASLGLNSSVTGEAVLEARIRHSTKSAWKIRTLDPCGTEAWLI